MTSDDWLKRSVDQAMAGREGRLAVVIAESMRNALDLIDAQPASVLGALTEQANRLQDSGIAPKHRYEMRAAVIKYLEDRRVEAIARERHLARAITGGELPDESV